MSIFSRVVPYFLLTLIAICIACVSTISVLGILEWRRTTLTKISAESTSVTNALRPETYQESVVVTSVNTIDKTIIAQVRSTTAGQFIPTILQYIDETQVVRRDVVIENGVIVGLTQSTKGTIADLLPGTYGIATITVSTEGDIILQQIIIGVPLPRP